jgi:hypothetical protein
MEDIYGQIDKCFSLFLTDLSEPKAGLRVIVSEGVLSEEITEDNALGVPSKKLEVAENSQHFELIFETYVFYIVVNESHGISEDDAVFTGNQIRKYTKSNLLKNANSISNPYDSDDRELKHFKIITENHFLSVITYCEPVISVLATAPATLNVSQANIWYRQ